MSGWVDFACYLVAFFFLVYGGFSLGMDVQVWVRKHTARRRHYGSLFSDCSGDKTKGG